VYLRYAYKKAPRFPLYFLNSSQPAKVFLLYMRARRVKARLITTLHSCICIEWMSYVICHKRVGEFKGVETLHVACICKHNRKTNDIGAIGTSG
jgi:hypothetical protein